MQHIVEANEYDVQVRNLCMYIVEFILLDHRFIEFKPSSVAAVGMYTAHRMLGKKWVSRQLVFQTLHHFLPAKFTLLQTEALVGYSGYTEARLIPIHKILIENLL